MIPARSTFTNCALMGYRGLNMRPKNLFLLLAVAALCGAGCFNQSTEQSAGNPQTSGTPSGSTSGSSTTDVTRMTSSTVMVDNTWNTYTSKGKDFSFKWPTRGVNAPMWSVSFYKENDPEITDGCYTLQGTPEKLTNPQGVAFCHTQSKGAAAGTLHVTDAYATEKDNQYIVIEMTKEAYSADAMGCSFAKEYPYSSSVKTCVAFEDEDYDAILNTIISTFAYSKTP